MSQRNEIRTAALRSMFGILTTHGRNLKRRDWKETLDILYSMLDGISTLAGKASHDEGLAYAFYCGVLLIAYLENINWGWKTVSP